MLIGSRAIQGIGAALMMPATLSIITHAFPRRRARQGDRHLGGRLGPGALDRPGGRWLPHRVRQLARDLLHQPSRGRRRRGRDASSRSRESRDETVDRRVDYPGVIALTASLTAIILALIEGNSWGWSSPGDRRAAGRRRDRARRIRRHRAAGRGADGRVRPLPDPPVHRLQPDRLHHHLRHDGHLLLHGALHAGHPRLQRAGGRGQVPADDDGDRGGRADLRAARRSARARALR